MWSHLFGVTAPYSTEVNQAIIAKPECQCNTLRTSVGTKPRRVRQRVWNVWFQHDGTTANTTRQNMTFC